MATKTATKTNRNSKAVCKPTHPGQEMEDFLLFLKAVTKRVAAIVMIAISIGGG